MNSAPVHITAAEVACALGNDLDSCVQELGAGRSALRPLGELLPEAHRWRELLAGWVPDRALLLGRRYGAATNLAVHVARAAVRRAGWTTEELSGAALFVGTSRGNFGEWVGAWKARRPVALFHASNQLHSEIAAAVSIELGIRGPWQVLSNGCASGLDALGWAARELQAGACRRVLAVAVELPLVGELLDAFGDTGALSRSNCNDPYASQTDGFLPGEGAAAVTLEAAPERAWCGVEGYAVTSDAYDSVAVPADGGALAECMQRSVAASEAAVVAVCPHANGTRANAESERAALALLGGEVGGVVCLKPFMGHALGAGGLVEAALLARCLRDGMLPPNLPGATRVDMPGDRSAGRAPLKAGDGVLKVSTAMGGHNASLVLRALRSSVPD